MSRLPPAVVLNREIGNRVGEASSLDGLGVLMLQVNDHAAARSLFEQALTIEREIGSVHDQAASLSNLGIVARKQGDLSLSRSLPAGALKLVRRAGARLQIASILDSLASLAVLESRPDRTTRLWAAADSLRQAIGAPLAPSDRDEHERDLAAARSSLGEAAFAVAWAEGRNMTQEAAIECALEVDIAP